MKDSKSVFFILIGFLIIGAVACRNNNKTAQIDKTPIMADHHGDQNHVMIDLPTVQCGLCKATIEKGLADVKGIISVDVDIDKKIAHVSYDSKFIDNAKIENAISALGYQANKTIADPAAYSKLPNCCKLPEDRM